MILTMHPFQWTITAILGLSFGSFYTVIIDRLPHYLQQKISKHTLLHQRSYCTPCQSRLQWVELIPVISYLCQKGHCRTCQARISLQHPLIELTTALLFIGSIALYGFNLTGLMMIVFQSGLLILGFIDFKHYLLPDVITLPLLWLGLIQHMILTPTSLHQSLWGCVYGYIICWLMSHGYYWLRKKPGLGLGDAKLCAMIGAWLGISTLSQILVESAMLACLVMTVLTALKRHPHQQPFPFGPFLVIASAINAWVNA